MSTSKSLKQVYIWTTLVAFFASVYFFDHFAKVSLSYNVCNNFLLNDTALQFSIEPEIVSTSLLFRICFTSLLVVLTAGETSRVHSKQTVLHFKILFDIVRSVWKYLQYILCGAYWSGLLLLMIKLRIGRLRPCFLEACNLNSSLNGKDQLIYDVSRCSNTNYHYYCQSFFSGHAMIAFYVFMSIAGYINAKKISWKKIYFIYCLAFSCLISYSRVLDSQHHLTDVIVGAAVGCIFAFLSLKIANV